MTDLGPVKTFLGLQIERNRSKGVIFLHQRKYIEDFLHEFGLQSCNPLSIPLDASTQLPAIDTETAPAPELQKLYQRMVGKLMYAMTGTRPDLAFAVATLAKYSSAPSAAHMAACKKVMRYLRGTSSHGNHVRKKDLLHWIYGFGLCWR